MWHDCSAKNLGKRSFRPTSADPRSRNLGCVACVLQVVTDTPSNRVGTAVSSLQGVPPLAACRVQLVWETVAAARGAVAAAEAAGPSAASLATRDPDGSYSPEEPFWAPVSEANVLTSAESDRRVSPSLDSQSRINIGVVSTVEVRYKHVVRRRESHPFGECLNGDMQLLPSKSYPLIE